MASIPFIGLVVLGIVILLKPQATVAVIQFRIPPESRSTEASLLPPAIMTIYIFSVGAFHSLPPTWRHWGHVNMSDPIQKPLTAVAGVFLLLCGVFACGWPLRFLRIASPRLKHINSREIGQGSMAKIELVSRCWGVLFLLTSAFLLQQFGG